MIISHKIGPTFAGELAVAGLGDGVAWSPDGVIVSDALTADTIAAIESVIAAHDPDKAAPGTEVTVIVKIDLYQRMTDGEYAAMKAGVAMQSERVQDVYRMADTFRSDSALWPLLKTMAIQLYGEQRAAELMTP